MIEFGRIIKEKRIANSLKIEDVRANLCISEEYILAIENDDLSIFSSDAYYYGYLKQYLKLLQLDEYIVDYKSTLNPSVSAITSTRSNFSNNYIILAISIIVISAFYLLDINFTDFASIDLISLEMDNNRTNLVQIK